VPDENRRDRLTDSGWSFNGFADEFQEHAAKHLPGYADVQRLVGLIASHVVPEDGLIADLGAATGETARALQARLAHRNPSFVLYDRDPSMCAALRAIGGARVVEGDLTRHRRGCGLDHVGADLTLALWTLQFLHPSDVPQILQALKWNASRSGALLIAAKTRHQESRWESIATGALDDYKAEMGVEPEERAAKTASLRGVLHAWSTDAIMADLRSAGWKQPTILWRWHVWTVIGAWATGPDGF
jgi:tRNA (cmo5U34)-methyltransferase